MSTGPSFSSIITQLREENARLLQQLLEVTKKAESEHEQRTIAEEGYRQSRSHQAQLEKDVQRYSGLAIFFRDIVTKCTADMEKVLPTLQEMRKSMSEATTRENTFHQA
jgi:hypothetical protein